VALKQISFGAGTGPILLDNVNCRGNETSLEDCEHSQWGQHNCDHSEDVSIVCADNMDITGNKLPVLYCTFIDFQKLIFQILQIQVSRLCSCS